MTTLAPESIGRSLETRVAAQLEGLGTRVEDIQLGNLKKVIDVTSRIVSGNIERSMTGASTVTLEILDSDRSVLQSGLLTAKSRIVIDGLTFRLTGVSVEDRVLSLVFEDEIVALLRQYDTFKKASRDKVTRAQFARQLVKEVKEMNIEFIAPERKIRQEIERVMPEERDRDRAFGFGSGGGIDLEVKGNSATRTQLVNIRRVLDEGVRLGVRRKLLITSIMVIIQESVAYNLPASESDPGSTGLFQQRADSGWPASNFIEVDARAFFQSLIEKDIGNPNLTHGALGQAVQRSAHPRAYDQWLEEATKIVEEYGYSEGDDDLVVREEPYFFSRGEPDKPENSWDALQRLADEVNWRCFVVSKTVYFVSETHLMRSSARANINDRTPGLIAIGADYDAGKKIGEIDIVAQIGRWARASGYGCASNRSRTIEWKVVR